MIEIRNIAKERLDKGELAIGIGLRQARTIDIAKIMKTAGLGGVYRQDLIERYVEMGFRMILAGSDLSLMMTAGKASASAIRALQEG